MRKPLEYIFPDPPSDVDPCALDQNAIPRHIAVIMDGNGRWARSVRSIVCAVIKQALKRYARPFGARTMSVSIT